ncbi:LexA family protein [Catenisphaera adipataccumulans]|jgi:repressor LexA|uniref:Repressor LexA n=1 Tax=Catenisphaera adipataccumulans TaxID=700500 RepID=A0A7W8CWA9_9FIRM|nr:S24 family peptidase [Catenisphaera adipataccumulans]MBB5182521.1 repressor LexA [Catenisphaera adipataccumulans]
MNIQQILQEYKRQNNITNEDIARQIGVTKSTVSRWCSGQTKKVSPDTLEKLSDLMHLDLDELTRMSEFAFEKPLLGVVKAGYGLLAEENLEGYLSVSEEDYKKGDYFLRVTGNSMINAKIHDGDLLYVEACSDVPSGTIAVVLIGHEEVSVKRVIKKQKFLLLEAANPDVETKIFTAEEVETLPVQIIGRVIYARTEIQ